VGLIEKSWSGEKTSKGKPALMGQSSSLYNGLFGLYDTRKCHDAIAARNAHAIISPRKNAKMWKPDTPSSECGATNQPLLMSKKTQKTEKAKARSFDV
jgi:hypothetical protein